MDIPANRLEPTANAPLARELRRDRAFEGLTNKQLAYCEARMQGMGVVQAYTEVYQPAGSKQSIYQNATAVEANSLVQSKLREMLREKNGRNSELPVIDKDFVVTGIAALALNATKQGDQLRAYELLGKAVGLFKPEEKLIEQPKTVNDIDAQLRDRLKAALAPVIDVEPHEVEVVPPGGSKGDEDGGPTHRKRVRGGS
jgi:hypothetical protein